MARTSIEALELKSLREKIDRYYKKTSGINVKVLIPSTINSREVLNMKPVDIIDDDFWKGAVFYLLHSICSKVEKRKFKKGKGINGFVSLKHKYLKDVIGKHTTSLIVTLIRNNIIERDSLYTVGATSLGYRLTTTHRKSNLSFVTISSIEIVKRFNTLQNRLNHEHKKRLKKHAYLIKWFLNNTLKIDRVAADIYLEGFEIRIKGIFKKLGLNDSELIDAFRHVDNTVLNCTNIMDNWNNARPTIDEMGGRLYSPLTSILSQLRYYTNHNDEQLIYFDIRNSQPFHMLMTLNPIFWSKSSKQREIKLTNMNKDLEEYLINRYNSKYISTIMILKEFAKTGRHKSNKGIQRLSMSSPHFAHLVSTGKLYKFISDNLLGKFRNNSGYDPFLSIKSAKHELIKMLYFNPKEIHSPSKKYFEEFEKMFPVVAGVIDLMKSRRYQDFSVLLQKIESTILLGNVCMAIFKKNTKIPIYTIHDGILTTVEFADEVEKIIKDIYKGIIGVEPELSKEVMNPNNAKVNLYDYLIKKTSEILLEIGREDKLIDVPLQALRLSDYKPSIKTQKAMVQYPDFYSHLDFLI